MSEKKILIVGMGMLGSAVRSARWAAQHRVAVASRKAPGTLPIDITSDESVNHFFVENPPFDVVINCAAEANVDACEAEPERARQVNALGVRRLAEQCRRTGAALIHISTDYVFDGYGSRPYREEDPTGPCSIYGTTKLEGEFYALTAPEVSAVIRSTWIFGGRRKDFVNGMIEKFKANETPGVVGDQTASPCFAGDLADAIGAVIEKVLLPARQNGKRVNRIFHCANRGEATRHAMAVRIAHRLGRTGNLPRLTARDIPSWIAVRPRYTVLQTDRIARECEVTMRSWEEALDDFVGQAGA